MTRILLAGLLGAIVTTAWGAIAWTVLHLHDRSIHDLPDEAVVVQALQSTVTEPGAYWFPAMPSHEAAENLTENDREAEEQAWLKAHRQGPIGMLFYRPGGVEPMQPITFIRGFVLDFAAATLAAVLLSLAAQSIGSYMKRVAFVMALGIFTALVSDIAMWNWMYFPGDYTIAMGGEQVFTWFLAGLAIAAVVRPRAETVA